MSLSGEPLHVGRPNIGDRSFFNSLVDDMFERAWFTNDGPLVRQFEERLSDYLGVRHIVAMANGTVALEIAIRALELEGEVIVPAYTFVATAHALHWQGITPVFADIDPATHTLCPESVARMITPRTTGILGVHLWGNIAASHDLSTVAENSGLKLLFDAAHAFGNSNDMGSVGNFGDAEVFSFHATKFFNSFEGGAVATNDDLLAEKMRLMRNFGFSGLDNVIYPGTNGKMTEICAAMGITNLRSIDEFLSRNEQNFAEYKDALAGSSVDLLDISALGDGRRNLQYVVVLAKDRLSRDDIVEALHMEKVLARKYFWPGVHRMEPYRSLFPHAGLMLPNTRDIAERVIVLPTGSAVSSEDIRSICRIIQGV